MPFVRPSSATPPQNFAAGLVKSQFQTKSFLFVMSLSGRVVLAVLAFVFLAGLTASAQYSRPRIFYSDLQSGPNTGGQDNLGAIVTVRGAGFGSTRGASTVTVGGGVVARYFSWSDTKIAFQLGAAPVSGNIVVKVGGVSSNGVAFTVRAARIYFVSTSGNDAYSGSYTSPWRTLAKAKNTIAAGDIVYAMNGIAQTGLDNYSASFAITRGGSSGLPMALVAYPGATVTIGSTTGQNYGILTPSISRTSNYWVLAGLTIRGRIEALTLSSLSTWRLVANDINCSNGFGDAACVHGISVGNIVLLGNRVHDSGSTSSTDIKNYDSVRFSKSANVEIGWNEVANTRGCDAVAFSASSTNQRGLNIHHNLIHDVRCNAITFETVDPSLGAVQAHDNVIYKAGTGPAPGGVEASYACIDVGTGGTGYVQVLNNTMYDCGARANADSGALAARRPVTLKNNIINVASGELYVTPRTDTSLIWGSNNLFYGAGAAPTFVTSSVSANPKFVDFVNHNFRLSSGSPAIDKGLTIWTNRDYDLVPRPQGAAFDIGAFEYSGTAVPAGTGQLVANPSSLSFGSVRVGATSTQGVTISNSGTGSATVSQDTVTNSAFKVNGLTLPATLAPGQSASYTVTFAPGVAGTISGTESLVSNALNSPATVALSGAGTTVSSSHSVTLSWAASTSPGIAGYYVYRGTQSGGPYTKLTSTLVTATSYTDSAVTAGATYYYVVTAVNSTGVQSAYSTQASAVVPTP